MRTERRGADFLYRRHFIDRQGWFAAKQFEKLYPAFGANDEDEFCRELGREGYYCSILYCVIIQRRTLAEFSKVHNWYNEQGKRLTAGTVAATQLKYDLAEALSKLAVYLGRRKRS